MIDTLPWHRKHDTGTGKCASLTAWASHRTAPTCRVPVRRQTKEGPACGMPFLLRCNSGRCAVRSNYPNAKLLYGEIMCFAQADSLGRAGG